MSSVDYLMSFLRARMDDDEQRARRLLTYAQQNALTVQDPSHLGKFMPGWHEWPDVERICTERLAEVEAKRDLLADLATLDSDPVNGLAITRMMRTLALPYADHPDYREEWRP